MAQERSNLERYDRIDPAESSLEGMRKNRRELENDPTRNPSLNAETAGDDEDLTMEAENIKEQIEETRSQMGETIDAIQDKLSFSNISEQVSDHVQNAVETAKTAVYDATIGKAAEIMKNVTNDISNSSIVRTAKNNPLPFVLIGAGAGWLAYKGFAGTLNTAGRSQSDFSRYRYQSGQPEISTSDSGRGMLDNVTGKISTTADDAMQKVSVAMDSAGEMMDRAYGKVDEFRGVAVDKYETYLNENPLALGAAALAIGAAVGMALPATRYEGQLLGETRDDFLDKAQSTAVGLLDKTKRAITDAGQQQVPMQRGSRIEH